MFDISSVKTPCYIVDEALLRNNLEILSSVMKRTGCKILLAAKCFSMYRVFPIIGEYLSGITASSLNEARLGREEMGREVHIFSPAYIPHDFDDICGCCSHLVFNSWEQVKRYGEKAVKKGVSCGIRVNPEFSTQSEPIYDPCAPFSRFGVTSGKIDQAADAELNIIEGLHFHTLCEQGSDALEATAYEVEKKFGHILERIKWINFGGGHHITKKGYDMEKLISVIMHFKEKYGLEVYLEPGEAVALDAGFLVSEVLDIVHNGMDIAILDASAACHMPDVLEMPYRPYAIDSGKANEFEYTYRFGGATCLAGDIIGDYSFHEPLKIGDKVVFTDMAIYSMVKNNTFNGVNLPGIIFRHSDGTLEIVKEFGYEDFKRRL